MDLNTIFSVIGFIFSIISLPSAIYFIVKKVIDRKHISWKKVEKGIKYLVELIEKEKPDIIITFSGKGAVVANLVLSELKNEYMLYTCFLRNSSYKERFVIPKNCKSLDTPKWTVYIPNEIFDFVDKDIWIIDDITRTGVTIKKVAKYLEDKGIPAHNIHSMSLIADIQVYKSLEIPQHYWKKVNTDEYSLPWNKAHHPKK